MTIFRTIIEKFKKETFDISSFHASIHKDDDEKFYWYLKNRVNKQNINLPNASGNTALHYSCSEKNIEFTKELLNAGAKANTINSRGESPLFSVCQSAAHIHKAYMDIIPIMMNPTLKMTISSSKYQEIFEIRNKNVETNLDLAYLLISHHADVNVVDNEKNTCLHNAMKAEHTDLVILLIEHGANLLDRNSDGDTPFDLALKAKSYEVLDAVFRNTKSLEEITVFIKETQKNSEVYAHYEEMLNSIQLNFALDASLETKQSHTRKIKI
jgi:ankyrin repeat protein